MKTAYQNCKKNKNSILIKPNSKFVKLRPIENRNAVLRI